ncbi:MAG: response regulator transcription factor [Alphaproteobacteria bacterium]|nr:response regulator transcription factor [Alphaproteobacteria bacterium]
MDILVYSENENFKLDLQEQIMRYIPQCRFVEGAPDVIVLDEKFAMFEHLRQKFEQIPIIFLTDISDFVATNLNIPVKKPFRLINLLDMITAANNKLDCSTDGYLRFNQYELRPQQKEIEDLVTQQIYKLTEKEVNILKYLYKNADKYIDKTDLQTNVWQYHQEVTTHTVETHIYRLRQKVEQCGRSLILIENGKYKLITRS